MSLAIFIRKQEIAFAHKLKFLPISFVGLEWVIPVLAGTVVGLTISRFSSKNSTPEQELKLPKLYKG
ncbi:hypothetical protein P4361_20405 [Fictibacillus sp. B-59209]|uniref:hypothetical protein n=1 Tax=Fictibacillus sp. B-59209 TaxID=3024873 RepID=UPI002E21D806|nr:hypothetical protein [Fictibacillus sp. B-59209]